MVWWEWLNSHWHKSENLVLPPCTRELENDVWAPASLEFQDAVLGALKCCIRTPVLDSSEWCECRVVFKGMLSGRLQSTNQSLVPRKRRAAKKGLMPRQLGDLFPRRHRTPIMKALYSSIFFRLLFLNVPYPFSVGKVSFLCGRALLPMLSMPLSWHLMTANWKLHFSWNSVGHSFRRSRGWLYLWCGHPWWLCHYCTGLSFSLLQLPAMSGYVSFHQLLWWEAMLLAGTMTRRAWIIPAPSSTVRYKAVEPTKHLMRTV